MYRAGVTHKYSQTICAGTTRSKRRRWKPLQFWRGERKVYERSKDGNALAAWTVACVARATQCLLLLLLLLAVCLLPSALLPTVKQAERIGVASPLLLFARHASRTRPKGAGGKKRVRGVLVVARDVLCQRQENTHMLLPCRFVFPPYQARPATRGPTSPAPKTPMPDASKPITPPKVARPA